MSKPIYKSFMGRMSEAWFALTAERQQEVLTAMGEARDKAGGKSVIQCDSSWSSDRYWMFGVEEFPSMEALQTYHAAIAKLDWFRYLDSANMSLLGTKME